MSFVFFKKYFFSIFLGLLSILALSLALFESQENRTLSWFDNFFESLEKEGIDSYHLLTYVQEGDLSDSHFVENILSFCQAVEKRELKNSPVLGIKFFLPPQTSTQSFDDFSSKTSRFSFVSVRLLDRDTLLAFVPFNYLSALSEHSDHSWSQNFLKILHLDRSSGLCVFLDSSLWKKYSYQLCSDKLFGIPKECDKTTSLWAHYQPSLESPCLNIYQINSDILIAKKDSQALEKLQKELIDQSQHYQERYLLFFDTLSLLKNFSEQKYDELLKKRIEYFQHHRKEIISDRLWLSAQCGPIFLEQQRQKQLLGLQSLELKYEPRREERAPISLEMAMTYDDLEILWGVQAAEHLEHILIRVDEETEAFFQTSVNKSS